MPEPTESTEPPEPIGSAQLPSGRSMPLLGFGTWQLSGPTAHDSVRVALDAGYRHIDTATMYGNEAQVGAALAASGVPREEVFLTSKLVPQRLGKFGVDLRVRKLGPRATLEQSLELLGVSQLDLWLVHWPPRSGVGESLWEQFVAARQDGLVRDIGVSNYSLKQVDRLTAACGVAPAVNQIRWSPSIFDGAVLAGHRERGVVLEGYSGLQDGVLKLPAVVATAGRLGCSPAQVVVRWHLDHEVVVIPRSRNPEHIRSNADVAGLRLSESDRAALDALGRT